MNGDVRVVNFSQLWLRTLPKFVDPLGHDRSGLLTEQFRDPLERLVCGVSLVVVGGWYAEIVEPLVAAECVVTLFLFPNPEILVGETVQVPPHLPLIVHLLGSLGWVHQLPCRTLCWG